MTKLKNFNKNRINGFSILILLIFATFTPCSVFGQEFAKRNISEADYHLWNYLDLEGISDNGEWISYRKYHESTDTLFIQNRKNKNTFHFAKPLSGDFKNNYFVCGTADGVLSIVSLKTGKVKKVMDVQKFETYKSFIVIEQSVEGEKITSLISFDGVNLYTNGKIAEYAVSGDEKFLCTTLQYENDNAVLLIDTKDFSEKEIIRQPLEQGYFTGLKWSLKTNVFAFFDAKEVESILRYYNVVDTTLQTLTNTIEGFSPTMNLSPTHLINISQDGTKVFFYVRQKKELNVVRTPDDVQIWNAKDKVIYPTAILTEGHTQNPKQAMWEPNTGRFMQIADSLQPFGGVARSGDFAITFHPEDYAPTSRQVPDSDYYIKDLNSGKSRLMVKQLIGGVGNIFVSPTGKYVSYFDKGDWHVYDVNTGITTVVTKNIKASFSIESLAEKDEMGYGNPGWTLNDEFILLYDEYDLWKVPVYGSKPERLTNGRENGVKYRLVPQKVDQRKTNSSRISTVGTFDMNTELLFTKRSIDHDYNGFSIWSKGKALKNICYVRKKINLIAESQNGVFVWLEEDVDQPPTIVTRSMKDNPVSLVASNSQQKDFNWTKEEIVTYKNRNGETLKGILYYPADYVPGKLYPMVVNIYQKQSHLVHTYTVPTLYNGDGFNKTNLTSKGYFVLLPDITYEIGEIGMSAVDCVEAAVKKVLESAPIDKNNIGLMGHSFGGTQTDFILTQSKLFKCAVAGAANTDYLSAYLSISKNYDVPRFYMMEYGQARMMVSPYENMDIYLKNSAVIHAAKITTPLLSWTGLQDGQVDPSQSFELYLALHKLKKEHVMLVYPSEEHVIRGKKQDADLTRKIEDWFDYYLKDSERPTWF